MNENEVEVVSCSDMLCFDLSELCFGDFSEHFTVYYESNKQYCPEAVFTASPKKPESGNMWQIESLVPLGTDCNYTVHVVLRTKAGETNFTGILTISEKNLG